ncbi:PLP-dependent aminotransferase family protein [Kitasatospora sp. NPDC052868]|uniref:PLP-dependent aminotransferase family protein n=1 Tax=Kitasatospora sp. NPDC052868 TaxID=3364060 RepID=UPI0037CAC3E2
MVSGPPPTARPPADLQLGELHGSLADPAMNAMNFLNEISARYPQAVSFAAGRPTEDFFDLEDVHRHLRRFTGYLRTERGLSEAEVRRTLMQYGRTKGIIHELIAAHLGVDEGITADPESVVVTNGCQEAMYLVLRALGRGPRDVVLAVSPTYVGFAGAARLCDLPVRPVHGGPRGVDLDDLARRLAEARAEGLRPRALYVIPDVANPTGVSMDLETRRALLAAAAEEGLLLLEDNPYGVFAGAGRPPSLKALDTGRRVVHLGSFAKTSVPGARIGYLVADQTVAGADGSAGLLADRISVLKSMLSVNTSPLAQAVVGGGLLAHGLSLRAGNHREIALYERNRRLLLQGLSDRFADRSDLAWNSPAGGFFLALTVPFDVDDALLEHSARAYGLLWTPMSYFYGGAGGRRQIRLSFSGLRPEEINAGLDRLAALVEERGR